MKTILLAPLFSLAMTAVIARPCLGRPAAEHPTDWHSATPASQGMSKEKLDALQEELARRKTRALLVIRNDRIVHEWYASGHGSNKKHGAASLSKATVAGLALGLLLSDGKLHLDTPVADLVPAWKEDPRKRKITLRHLGSHTSGLADAEQDRLPHGKLTGWKGDFWKALAPPRDPFTLARDQAPVLFDPGTKLQYSNPAIAMLGYAVTAALKDMPQKDIRTLLRERVMWPIGVADRDWSIGYGKTFEVDGLPLVAGWGGGSYTARAVARIGRLLLRQGDWDGKQILRKEAVRLITGDAGLPGHCGMGFWTNADGRYPRLPRDTYYGAGAGDQLLIVIPSLKLIVVRNGETLAPEPKGARDVFEAYHDQRVKILFEPVIDAITDRSKSARAMPYPPSTHVTGITWAPKETIIRKAKGSDNWPLTWADDDSQCTAYGDGWGFEPFVPKKLSLGFARIVGDPPGFKGSNIPSPTGEQIGGGARAKKASGILCVEGVLYLWTRNAGNAQLVWSKDHGKTWEWADWKLSTSFGCPTLLNFGKNYKNARDDWVYVYSHDADSAYQPADRMVLARVPKKKIIQRNAYEFFAGLDGKQQPLWSKEIGERAAVFTHKGRCYRSGITFNAGIGRYLWVQIIPGTEGKKADTRFEGGFGVYDAPQPWGPWTTVYFTEKWDVGPGESASFPTRWISADGKTLHLVFSGDDCFSVRKATLEMPRAKTDPNALRQAAMNNGGDARRGKEIYLSASAKCAICHKVHGQGGDVGPDLSQVGGKLDRTHLIESILDPSAEILQGYHATTITTKAGRIITGIVKAESPQTLTLLDAEGKQVAVPLASIELREVSKVSLMPTGLAEQMTTAEFTDLIAYLASLRSGPAPTPGQGTSGLVSLPVGFTAKVTAGGLTGATALEVAPDGRTLVCEQTGALRVIKYGKLLAEPFVKLAVDSTWERGLIGVTVAPDFPKTPHVFVCYVAAKPYPHHVISRFTAAGDVAAAGSEKILFEGDDQTKLGGTVPAGHQGGAIHFGKDGKLYVAIGDQTAGKPAQEVNSLLGRLLRINPDGSIPTDNPFYSSARGKYRATWALGLRNPFTFAVQQGTGRIFLNDVGGNAEEINEGKAGANYGWPIVEHGPTSDPRFRGPIHHYPTACIAGGAFAPEDLRWPKEYRGRYFFGDFNHGRIQTIDPTSPREARPFASGLRRPVDLRFGPDGSLYVLLRDAWVIDTYFKGGTGALLRIQHVGSK
jgi:putative heme-binding domain-containing protein